MGVKWWFRRTIDNVRWWLCNFTGGHEWAALWVYEMPRTGDWRAFGASTICRRCKLNMHNRVTVSEVMLATTAAKDTEIIDYHKQRMVRQLIAATAGRALPVVERFEDFMASIGNPAFYPRNL